MSECGRAGGRACVCVWLSILQSQFIEKCFKKTESFEHSGLLLLILFTQDMTQFSFLATRFYLENNQHCDQVVIVYNLVLLPFTEYNFVFWLVL